MTAEEHAIQFAERIKNLSDKNAKVTVNIIDGMVNYNAGDNQFSIPLPDWKETVIVDEMMDEWNKDEITE